MDPISLIFIRHSSVVFLLDPVLAIYIFQESLNFHVIFIYCQKSGYGIILYISIASIVTVIFTFLLFLFMFAYFA